MAVPKYNEIMLPLLKLAGDKKPHSMSESYGEIASLFNLSEEDRKELLPSGQQNTFENRVGWARTYLKKAGLLLSKRRGFFEITEQGLEVLKENPKSIDSKYLRRFPEFLYFKARPEKDNTIVANIVDETTPKDLIEESYRQLTNALSDELLDLIKNSSDSFFEKLVVDLLVKIGYGGSRKDAGKAIGKSGDEGIDGVINEDRLGLDIIYIQAKKWSSNKVGGRDIRNFLGSLDLKKANKGIFITTSSFSPGAEEAARKSSKNVILIDGIKLTSLMIEFGLAVSTDAVYSLKRIDGDYFENA